MTPNLNDLADRLESFIPRGDGYNSDYANTLAEAVEVLRAKAAPTEPTEAVEVVGVVCVSRFRNNPAMENVEFHQAADIPQGQHPLMTVAQHKRLMANHSADDSKMVKVPRELLARIERYFGGFTCDYPVSSALGDGGLSKLRALLGGAG